MGLEGLFEGSRKYILFAATLLLAVVVGVAASVSGSGYIPSPVPGFGEKAAIAKVAVSSTWTYYSLFVADTVRIKMGYNNAKVKWDSLNNKVDEGETLKQ